MSVIAATSQVAAISTSVSPLAASGTTLTYKVTTSPPVGDTIPDEQGGGESVVEDTLPAIDPMTQTTLPAGCSAPRAAKATFLGQLVSTDDLIATFRVLQVRGGSLDAYVDGGLIAVRYSDRETRFLDSGQTYLVGAGASELFTTLESKVRTKKELFGGDAVVGIDESDAPCPKIEDAIITLKPNGELVESGVLALLRKQPRSLLQIIVLPTLLVMIFLIGLVITKRLIDGARRSSRRN